MEEDKKDNLRELLALLLLLLPLLLALLLLPLAVEVFFGAVSISFEARGNVPPAATPRKALLLMVVMGTMTTAGVTGGGVVASWLLSIK